MKYRFYATPSFILFMVLFSIKQIIIKDWLVGIPWFWLAGTIILAFTFTFVFFISCIRYKLRALMIAFYILHAIYFYAQFAYFHVYKDILNPLTSISLIKELGPTLINGGVVFNLYSLIILIDLPFFLVTIFNYKYLFERHIERDGKRALRKMRWVLLGIFLIAQISFMKDEPVWIERKPHELLDEQRLIVCNGYIIHNWYYWRNSGKNSDRLKQIKYGPLKEIEPATKTPMNIVFLEMESFQSGVVDLMHKGKPLMPFLHAARTNSIYYPYMVSYHWAGGTSDAEISILNNIFPLKDYPLIQIKDYNFSNNVMRNFKSMGYQAYAFHNNHGRFFNRVSFYQRSEIDYFFDKVDMGYTSQKWDTPDSVLFDFLIDKQHKAHDNNKPYFYFAISLTGHQGFSYVNNYTNDTSFDDIAATRLRDFYKTQRYVDQNLKRYVTYVKNNLPNTWIFVYGDHSIEEAKGIFRRPIIVENDTVYEFVPLFIFSPDNQVKNGGDFLPTFHDLGPTALALAGQKVKYKAFGQNLLSDDLVMDANRTVLKNIITELMKTVP